MQSAVAIPGNQRKPPHIMTVALYVCISFRVKTSELFERWRNLQVCKWEQNKEEIDNFK